MLNNQPVVSWVSKRYSSRAKDEYRLSPTSLTKHREIETVFRKFDVDGSGSLDT